jgi:hypothetical protein
MAGLSPLLNRLRRALFGSLFDLRRHRASPAMGDDNVAAMAAPARLAPVSTTT